MQLLKSVWRSTLQSFNAYQPFAVLYRSTRPELWLLLCIPLGGASILVLDSPYAWAITLVALPFGVECVRKQRHYLTSMLGIFLMALGWYAVATCWTYDAFLKGAPTFSGAVFVFSYIAYPLNYAWYFPVMVLLLWRYREHRAIYAVVFAVCFSLCAWVSGYLPYDIVPAALLGYGWYSAPYIMQSLAFIGIYGLTLLSTVGAMCLLFPSLGRWVVWGVFMGMMVLGAYRFHSTTVEVNKEYGVRIVQPGFSTDKKWNHDNVARMIHLAQQPSKTLENISLYVLPESVIVNNSAEEELANLQRLSSVLSPNDYMVVGSSLKNVEQVNMPKVRSGGSELFSANTMVVVDAKGAVLERHQKYKLAPYGEYLPFPWVMQQVLPANMLQTLRQVAGNVVRGPAPHTWVLPEGLPTMFPLICYEATHPGLVKNNPVRADVLVNVSDDNWYIETRGALHEFYGSVARAIEHGVPMIRSANTGISAMVDPLGRIVGVLDRKETGVVDAYLPKPLPETLYARFGEWIFLLLSLVLLLGCEGVYRHTRSRITQRG